MKSLLRIVTGALLLFALNAFAQSLQPGTIIQHYSVQSAGDTVRVTVAGDTTGMSFYNKDRSCQLLAYPFNGQVYFYMLGANGYYFQFDGHTPIASGFCRLTQAIGVKQLLSSAPGGPTLDIIFTWQYETPLVDTSELWMLAAGPRGYEFADTKKVRP